MADRPPTARVHRRAFRGADLSDVGAQARAALGDDALILSTRVLRSATGPLVEVVAASAREVARFERRMSPDPLTAVRSPVVLALVGPTGAGKTTTAVKLATHADAFGGRRVAFITLDTYRAGAVAQLETFADVAALPLEVAYDAKDAAGALERLASYDVVLVDTPGRGPREQGEEWRDALAALAPDEVHLVLPATMRGDLAEHVRAAFDASAGAGPRLTHLLLTKLDEVPGDVGVADLAAQLGLPTRWVTDGQEIPADLVVAVPRLVNALGGDEMSAQLASLRQFVAGRASAPGSDARAVIVASGRGGVGTSVCATLLALTAAAQGVRTLLVDGDEHVGPLRYLLGVTPERHLADLRDGGDPASLVVPLGDTLGFVPGGAGADGAAPLAPAERRALLRRVATLFPSWELVVVDAGSRLDGVTGWCSDPHAARLVAVMGVDAVSLAATYALVKAVRQRSPAMPAEVLVSRHDDAAAARAFAHVEGAARQFALGDVAYAGALPDDASLDTALRAGMPLADAAAGSVAAHAAFELAARLAAEVARRAPPLAAVPH